LQIQKVSKSEKSREKKKSFKLDGQNRNFRIYLFMGAKKNSYFMFASSSKSKSGPVKKKTLTVLQ